MLLMCDLPVGAVVREVGGGHGGVPGGRTAVKRAEGVWNIDGWVYSGEIGDVFDESEVVMGGEGILAHLCTEHTRTVTETRQLVRVTEDNVAEIHGLLGDAFPGGTWVGDLLDAEGYSGPGYDGFEPVGGGSGSGAGDAVYVERVREHVYVWNGAALIAVLTEDELEGLYDVFRRGI